jgi:hypothetical protein
LVVQPGAGPELAVQAFVDGTTWPAWLIVISRAPILADTFKPAKATGTE